MRILFYFFSILCRLFDPFVSLLYFVQILCAFRFQSRIMCRGGFRDRLLYKNLSIFILFCLRFCVPFKFHLVPREGVSQARKFLYKKL